MLVKCIITCFHALEFSIVDRCILSDCTSQNQHNFNSQVALRYDGMICAIYQTAQKTYIKAAAFDI